MTASEIRKEAREKLTGKWGKVAFQVFIYGIITYLIAKILSFFPLIDSIVSLIISAPLSYGLLLSIFKIIDAEENDFSYVAFLSNGFTYFGKSWSILFHILLKLFIPILLYIASIVLYVMANLQFNQALLSLSTILGFASSIYLVIKELSYCLAFYISYETPAITAKEAVEKSGELMRGKVWSFFCLNLSFIGWAILCVFTFGIGLLWLFPYIMTADICFYRNLTGEITTEK